MLGRPLIIKARKPEQLTEIERLAAKLEPALSKAILAMLNKMADAVDLDAVVQALKSGDVSKVVSLIAATNDAGTEQDIAEALQDAVWAGAGVAGVVGAGGNVASVAFVFDRLNPRLIDWLKGYSLGLIKELKETAREAVREKLMAGMTAGENPIAVARGVKTVVGLTRRQAKAVENYRKELETFHLKRSAASYGLGKPIDRVNGRQVFKPSDDGTPKDGVDLRRLRDFRYDGQLSNAVSSGKPLKPEQIDKMVAAYARKYRQYRAQTIARTEALRATNFGVQDAWRQAIEQGAAPEALVRRKWVVSKDERTCEVCAPVPGLNPVKGVPFGQPFNTPSGPQFLPPMHPNCRCTVFIRRYEPEQMT